MRTVAAVGMAVYIEISGIHKIPFPNRTQPAALSNIIRGNFKTKKGNV